MGGGKPLRRVAAEDVCFLLIDIQDKLFPHIANEAEIRANSIRLLAAARLLDIPTICTEQYPKGIGGTDAEIAKAFPENARRFEKLAFSCFDEPGFAAFHAESRRPVTVVWGIETHICVETTVMDMLDADKKVAVVCDAVGSRTAANRAAALDAMARAGALIVSTETVVYQMLKKSGSPEFKAMLPFFK